MSSIVADKSNVPVFADKSLKIERITHTTSSSVVSLFFLTISFTTIPLGQEYRRIALRIGGIEYRS